MTYQSILRMVAFAGAVLVTATTALASEAAPKVDRTVLPIAEHAAK